MKTPESFHMESHRFARALFENTLEGIAIHRMMFDERHLPVDYMFLDVNAAFETLTGLARHEVIGKRITEVMPEIIKDETIGEYGRVVTTGIPLSKEIYSSPLNRHFFVNAIRLEGDVFATAFFDISQRKETEEKFRVIFDGTSQGILAFDIASGAIQYVNPAISQLFGYTVEELLRMNARQLHPVEVHGEMERDLQRLLMKKNLLTHSMPCLRKNQEQFWAEIHTNCAEIDGVTLAVGFYTDISEQRRAVAERDHLLKMAETTRRVLLSVQEDERRGQTERARLVMAIEQVAEAVVITDTHGYIQFVNTAFTTISGYTREEALGQHTRFLKSGRQDEAFYRDLWDTIIGGNVWTGRMINRKKNGEYYTEVATISPVFDLAGKLINFVAVKRDISREIEIEQQLAQSQKMEVVGQLAGGVAHDFNTILQSLLGYTELAITEDNLDVLRNDYLKEIRRGGESAAALTRQLLAFSRRQVLEKKIVVLNELIERMGKMIRRVIGEDITLIMHLDPHIGVLFIDPGQTEQVILNLVVNARDAMPDGGNLIINTSTVSFTKEDRELHPESIAGTFVCLSVSDTGKGMTDDVKHRIFEPFFTTKGIGKGTGLGLATVFGIVKQHDGWISVYSEPGNGSEFHIYLPVHSREENKPVVEPPEHTPHGNGQRILLCEDEDMVRNLIARLLSRHGYQVQLAATAEDALALFTSSPEPFDLVFTDVVLPGRSGFDLVTELKSLAPNLKVLMASGYTDDRTRWSQIKQQGWRYLQKPVSSQTMLRTLDEMFNGPANPET